MDGDRDDLSTQEPSTGPPGQPGDSPDGRPEPAATNPAPGAAEGVLGSLPRTRPQRPSPRRAAQAKAKRAGGKAGKARAERPDDQRTAEAKPKRKPAPKKAPKKAPPRPAGEPPPRPKAPRQGYEPEEDLDIGGTVHPPSAVELVESVADIALELASASLKSGGRLLRDALSPLRRS